MQHARVNKDENVFSIGDAGNKFYITLRGTVGVIVRLPKEVIDPVSL